MKVVPDPLGPGQESVWSYPRPAVARPCGRLLEIVHRGIVVARTRRGVRTLETSHPPSYYFPREDVAMSLLRPSPQRSVCEWKGRAVYFDVVVENETLENAAWSYPDPTAAFESLRDHIAFYPAPFEVCSIDGERVRPQSGGFYGGWITSHVAGPFKGAPGTMGW